MTAPQSPDQSRTSPDGRTGPQAFVPNPPGAKFISLKQYRARRGNCSMQTVDRAIKNDPDFPPIILFGRLRYLEVVAVEKYEAICRERAIAKAAEKAAAKAARELARTSDND